MTTATAVAAAERPRWRSVAVPNEHGGWGLTAEPILLGLLVAPSLAGVCLGFAALLAFLVRTPLKLVSIDVRRRRWIDRSRIAARVAAVEVAALGGFGAAAVVLAGWEWIVPVALAAPLIALEWFFDSRGRGRRLIPELAGAAGISAAAASIVVAGGGPTTVAAGVWVVLVARTVGSIPFVRVQIARLRRGVGEVGASDLAQVAAVLVAAVAVVVEESLFAGSAAVAVLALLHVWLVRRPPVPAKQVGLTEMALGFVIVIVTATGVIAG